jgi:hypothetical protein
LLRATESTAARVLFVAAIVAGLWALFVDLRELPAQIVRLEEAYEVIAESLFLSALLETARASRALQL